MLNHNEDYVRTVNTSPLTPLKKDDFQKDSRFEGLHECSSSRVQERLDPSRFVRLQLIARAFEWPGGGYNEEDCRNMTPITSSSSPLPWIDQELVEYIEGINDIPKLVPQDLSDKSIPISNAHTTHEVSQDLPEMDNLPDIEKLHIKDGHETDSLPSEFSKSCNLK